MARIEELQKEVEEAEQRVSQSLRIGGQRKKRRDGYAFQIRQFEFPTSKVSGKVLRAYQLTGSSAEARRRLKGADKRTQEAAD